jgi:selenocysteine lyase/cysteine desulfurase
VKTLRNFFTAQDVDYALYRGENVIFHDEDDIITAAAMEYAKSKGVQFVIKGKAALKTHDKLPDTAADKEISPAAAERKAEPAVLPAASNNRRLTDSDIDRWREEFPILKDIIHVANCSQSAQSRRVRDAINRYLDSWLTVGMDWDYWMEEVFKAKMEFAKLINADVSEIAISTSVSEAVSSIASAIDYTKKRKKIVTTEAEFPTVAHVWLAHQKYGGKVDFVPVHNGEIQLEQYERYVDQDTILASVTHVYYYNGFKQDLEAITDICHQKGALVLVDAYQSLGTTPIDVKKMKIDILASGNLKYLFGIPGVAFLYVNKDLSPMLKPAVTGWFGQENPFSFHVRYIDYASDARRFDTGTPPVLTSFAARAGMEIINEVGIPAISERIDMLSKFAIEGCLSRGLEIASPLDINKKGGTTAIKLKMDSHLMEKKLAERNIIASARGDVIRVAPHFYTRPDDIEHVLDQIKDIIEKNSM